MPSLQKSQLPLTDGSGASIIPQRKSKCPKCHLRAWCPVVRTVQGPDVIIRERFCEHCHFHFETEEKRLKNCMHCGAFKSFDVIKSARVEGKIHRELCCRECRKYDYTSEVFPNLNPRTSKDFPEWRR